MMAGTFRYTVWDPLMIVCQMATLQCAFYVSLGLWIFFFDLVGGMPRSLDHIFKYEVSFIINLFVLFKELISGLSFNECAQSLIQRLELLSIGK